ncbi:HET-domain-containing protein, partial [Rhizodiscina lignyota]
VYSPLNNENEEIRVLLLQPDTEGQPIHCSLEIVSLQAWPDYEALSYVWGDASNLKSIYIDETAKYETENLEIALLHLRHETQHRRLWVDAVSINQEDNDEKSKQVEQMKKIYQFASRVLVWLGKEENGSDLGMELLETFDSWVEVGVAETINAVLTENDWDRAFGLIYPIFFRRWWTRAWTLQEYVVAREPPLIGCG